MIAGLYKIFDHWHKNGTVWIFSDTHFGDPDIHKAFPNRPSDVQLVKNINSKVGKKDTLILLGDVGDPAYVRQLRGYKVLIMGNHDMGRSNYERVIVSDRYAQAEYEQKEAFSHMKNKFPNCKYTINEAYISHTPFSYWEVFADNQLFDEVYEGSLIIGEKYILSHEPVCYSGLFNFHGHEHHRGQTANKLNVCADMIGYFPVNLNQFMKTGPAAKIKTAHRETINRATKRKRDRNA